MPQEADAEVTEAVLREIVKLLVPGIRSVRHYDEFGIAEAESILAGAASDHAQHEWCIVLGDVAAPGQRVEKREDGEQLESAARQRVRMRGVVAADPHPVSGPRCLPFLARNRTV